MLGNKKEITQLLKLVNEETIFFIEEYKATKAQKSRVQERTYYRCFNLISKKMGYSVETVKQNTLKGCFGVEKVKFGGVYYENALKPKTSELTKEEATFLIDALIEFGKKLGIQNMVTPRELQDLFYN